MIHVESFPGAAARTQAAFLRRVTRICTHEVAAASGDFGGRPGRLVSVVIVFWRGLDWPTTEPLPCGVGSMVGQLSDRVERQMDETFGSLHRLQIYFFHLCVSLPSDLHKCHNLKIACNFTFYNLTDLERVRFHVQTITRSIILSLHYFTT